MGKVHVIFGIAVAGSAALVVSVFALSRVELPTPTTDPAPPLANTDAYIVLYVDEVETLGRVVDLSSLTTTSLEVSIVGASSEGLCSARIDNDVSKYVSSSHSQCRWSLPPLAPGYYELYVHYQSSVGHDFLAEQYHLVVR